MGKKGFTLIELIVFLAVIIGLFLMVFGNMIDWDQQTRSKIVKAESELRNLATALIMYYDDEGRFPVEKGKPWYGLQALTTPSQYLTTLPHDSLNHTEDDAGSKEREWSGYRYASDENNFLLLGYGMDGKAHVDLSDWKRSASVHGASETLMEFVERLKSQNLLFDPSNGIPSSGDIWRTGP